MKRGNSILDPMWSSTKSLRESLGYGRVQRGRPQSKEAQS